MATRKPPRQFRQIPRPLFLTEPTQKSERERSPVLRDAAAVLETVWCEQVSIDAVVNDFNPAGTFAEFYEPVSNVFTGNDVEVNVGGELAVAGQVPFGVVELVDY